MTMVGSIKEKVRLALWNLKNREKRKAVKVYIDTVKTNMVNRWRGNIMCDDGCPTSISITNDIKRLVDTVARMGLPNEDRKELLQGLIDDMDKSIVSKIEEMCGLQSGSLPLNNDEKGDEPEKITEFQLTGDFPLYVGQSGIGDMMNFINLSFQDGSDSAAEFLRVIMEAIDGWLNLYKGQPFKLSVFMRSHGSTREFECYMTDIMLQSIDLNAPVADKTPLRIRLCVKTAVPEYIQEIKDSGYFYLTGYADVDDSNKVKMFDLVIKGLGYCEKRIDNSKGHSLAVMKPQVVLGEE